MSEEDGQCEDTFINCPDLEVGMCGQLRLVKEGNRRSFSLDGKPIEKVFADMKERKAYFREDRDDY